MDTRIIKKVCFIVTLSVSGLMIGCSQNKITKTESESINLSTDVGADIATTNPEKSIVSSDMAESSMDTLLSETLAEQPIDNYAGEKQAVIDQLKKQAEENAEKDRYSIIEALGDAESDERCSAANQFIKEHYPDYFSSDELLQSSIEYGHYLVSLYKDSEGLDNGRGRYYEMGKLVSEAAQNIYLGINKSTDESVLGKMQELERQLEFIYDKYYGKLAANENISPIFSVHDIFVSGAPALNEMPFMLANIEDIQANEVELEEIESTEHANGHFMYWKGEGIIYVTHSSGQELVSVILNSDNFSLNCGLKTGMTEAEIIQLNLIFKKFTKEDLKDSNKSIAFASNLIRDEESPISKEDFDSLYVYVDSIPEEEMDEYGITTTNCISIVALIKAGTVSNIILDMPTAG